jgi:hypothetical protein
MNNKKKPPFIISRSNSSRSSIAFLDKSLSNSFEDPMPLVFRKQASFLSKQNSFNFHDSAFKSHYNIFKTDASLLPDLLEKYSQDNLQYRDEEFTQQAETFITKIAADKKIPKDLRAKFPLYQILISICKIFMLNEYEIVVFACSLDHCNWKIEEVVSAEEADFLREFPSNFGVEISDECKRFIMYLLIITFSLKQYLNEKTNVDKVQAYCEKICMNFQALFNRWTKISSFHKFNYSAPEINRKFKYLSKREYGDNVTSVKDYNMIVDNIMVLTGSYSSKPKIDAKPMVSPPPANISNNHASQKTEIFHELPSLPIIDPKILYHEGSAMPSLERGLSRNKTLDFMTESPGVKIPSAMGGGYSRQGSISTFLAGFPLMKRQNSFDFFDELNRKLLKQDTFNLGSLGANANQTSSADLPSNKESSGLKIPNPILLKSADAEELGNLVVPTLSKKSSTVSQQMPEENPSLSRFNSNFSFLYEK